MKDSDKAFVDYIIKIMLLVTANVFAVVQCVRGNPDFQWIIASTIGVLLNAPKYKTNKWKNNEDMNFDMVDSASKKKVSFCSNI